MTKRKGFHLPELDQLVCDEHGHARKRGSIVTLHRGGDDFIGMVLTEGFDVHGAHVGWVGAPGQLVAFRQLCALPLGDAALYAVSAARAQADGRAVEVRAW